MHLIFVNHFDKNLRFIMGAKGSGRYGERGGRACAEQFPRLTLVKLLASWREAITGYLLDDDTLMVNDGRQSWAVGLATTHHRWGGRRRWLVCPQCGVRCAVLYLRGAPACRRCHHLTYASQMQDVASRRLLKWARSPLV